MAAPSVEQEAFIVLEVDLRMHPVGGTPFGTRLEVPFEGTATSRLWEGERSVWGVDHITVSTAGTAEIDVHVVIDGGDEIVIYRGHGRGTEGGVREGVTFETASERLAWLNDAVALGKGTLTADHLTVELFLLTS
jgi:Protein of unknown function (DUF3237)